MKELNSKNNMLKAYLYVLGFYTIALISSLVIGRIFSFLHPLLMILFADLVATFVIFIGTTILRNTSLYDPYWSVAPLIISLYYLIFPKVVNPASFRYIIVVILVSIYSIRLTYNWLRQWRGLKHEDWRYTMYRTKMGKKFWLINIIGL